MPSMFQLFRDASAGPDYKLFDVQLVDALEHDDGRCDLVVECSGQRDALPAGRLSEDFDRSLLGQWGYLQQKVDWALSHSPTVVFTPYVDQSLRRAPELDGPDPYVMVNPARAPQTVGWRCSARPDGLRAPVGLVPGFDGRFDGGEPRLESITVPSEFLAVCRSYGKSAAQVLGGFMADVCELEDDAARPRADGLHWNGEVASELARQWVVRAYGEPIVPRDGDDPFADSDDAVDPLADYSDDPLMGPLVESMASYLVCGGDQEKLEEAIRSVVDPEARREAQRGADEADEVAYLLEAFRDAGGDLRALSEELVTRLRSGMAGSAPNA